jgi:hypothetical protein
MTVDRRESRPDPWTMLTEGLRQMGRLELGDIKRGLENFTNPSARGMLESLGRTRDEQVEKMAAMLRNSSEDDIAEMGQVFGLAMAKLAEENAAAGAQPQPQPQAQPRSERARSRPRQSAAERRRERRLAS